jgi:hypothetical protein
MCSWLLASGVLAAAPVSAQEVATLRVSLEDAQSRAVMASHRLAEARARAAAAEGAVAARELSDDPNVALGITNSIT